jgi:hypothetical protein
MNIVILGGTNNEKGELNNYTKNRIIKCHQMLSNIKDEKKKCISKYKKALCNKMFTQYYLEL